MFFNSLINVETGSAVNDAEIIIHILNKIFAPFFDLPSYFLTLPYPRTQIISWLLWLLAVWVIYSLIRLKGRWTKKSLSLFRGMTVITVSFLLFILYCIFCPLPQNLLKSKNPDEFFIDLHSHTIYSHDGIVTPERSFYWHVNHGFNGWATTEHDWIGGAPAIQKKIIQKNFIDAAVIEGEEISFKGIHLNLLGIKENIDAKKYKDLDGMVEDVHNQGGAVIVPHLWAETRSTYSMDDLYEAGVDGFEIAGNASVYLTQERQQEIIAFCQKKGLVMVSGTNWHGWRNSCNVWTGIRSEDWKQMDMKSREKYIISSLRDREVNRFRVIGYPQKRTSNIHYIFEPFTGFYFYFLSLDIWQKLSWLFWILVIYFLLRLLKGKRYSALILWSVITLVLLAKSISVHSIWKTVSEYNDILPDITKGFLIMTLVTTTLALTNIRRRHT